MFSLIGPKRYDAPWKDIEAQGWIAPADCTEVRVTLTDAERMAYATAEPEERYRVAATARTKLPVVRALVDRHAGDQVLVIGAYIDQLHQLGEYLDAPIIQGSTTNKERERLFDAFRAGEIPTLVISKVGNFSIDLPEAAVAIQVSGHVRLPPGGGAAARPGAAAEGRRPAGALLHGGLPGHDRHRVRRAPAAVPRRAGLRVHDRRRRRRPRPAPAHHRLSGPGASSTGNAGPGVRRSSSRSPYSSTRSSTSAASNWRPASPTAPASTSSQVSGVDTVGVGWARSEYGATVVFAAAFWLQSMNTLPGRSSWPSST